MPLASRRKTSRIHAKDVVPAVLVLLGDALARGNAGVVEQHIEQTERLDRLADSAVGEGATAALMIRQFLEKTEGSRGYRGD